MNNNSADDQKMRATCIKQALVVKVLNKLPVPSYLSFLAKSSSSGKRITEHYLYIFEKED